MKNFLVAAITASPLLLAQTEQQSGSPSTTRPVLVTGISVAADKSSLSVQVAIQNIAYTKSVILSYCDLSNACGSVIGCGYSGNINGTFETWSCVSSTFPTGVSSFVAVYSVSGTTYKDLGPDGQGGYKVSLPPTPPKPITSTTSRPATSATSVAITSSTTSTTVPSILPGCQNYNGLDSCNGDQFTYDPSVDARQWQTPNKTSSNYTSAFGDLGQITGYSDSVYSSNLKSCTLTIKTFTKDPQAKVECAFGAQGYADSLVFAATSTSFPSGPLSIDCRIKGTDYHLQLDDFYFYWDTMTPIDRPETKMGQKGAIVELFGWPYEDIGQECAFLGKAGYMGVRVWAPNEHVISNEWLEPDGNFNPWYFVYQPVSYRLQSRQGTLKQLREMVRVCRAAGVRVYADAVVNHMTGNGNAVNPKRNGQGNNCVYWGPHNSTAYSPYFTHGYSYKFDEVTGARPALEFPAVPYSPSDFHCERSLSSYTSGFVLQYGWLSGLADLNTGKVKVQERIATYFATLMSVGFSGFRIDSGKHVSPDDWAAIFARFSTKMGGSLPPEFITYLEVLIGGEKDLLCCTYNNYNYYTYFTEVLGKAGLSATDINKIKIWSSDYPKEFPVCGQRFMPDERFVIQNDDHDQQNPGSSSRDMQDKGSVLIVQKDVAAHRNFEVQLFTRTDGNWAIRQILSSYYFKVGEASGWPDGLSDCSKYTGNTLNIKCKGIPYQKAFQADACGYSMIGPDGNWVLGAYTRVHRDLSIVNAMRRWMGLSSNLSAASLGLSSKCT